MQSYNVKYSQFGACGFENKPKIGEGIYTMPDVSRILGIPNPKVRRWAKNFWDKKFADHFGGRYTFGSTRHKAVNFLTLIEFYSFIKLTEFGVWPSKIVKAHQELSEEFETKYPFAMSDVLKNIKTDGKKIYFQRNDKEIYCLDGKKQLNLDLINFFLEKVDFNTERMAELYWPIGREYGIVCDPKRQFGQPIILGTSIQAVTIFSMYNAGETIDSIMDLYSINKKQVKDAIRFYKEN